MFREKMKHKVKVVELLGNVLKVAVKTRMASSLMHR